MNSEVKYLLFNWDFINSDINDPSELTDSEFEKLASGVDGLIFYNHEDFESAFNAELFSTITHQLRIIFK